MAVWQESLVLSEEVEDDLDQVKASHRKFDNFKKVSVMGKSPTFCLCVMKLIFFF